MANYAKELENKLDHKLSNFDKDIQKFGKRSEDRLDEFKTALNKLEQDTLWKIKEYESLLY